jgi:IS30 family transposase
LFPEANGLPDTSQQTEMRDQQDNAKSYAAANAERKKQIAEDSAKLLKLATDLKAEVEKTDKDTLSLNVIRRAGEIEKLAHSVREKMKMIAGASIGAAN